jgi:membrane protein DedA with SNARE-associated domain
VSEGTEQKKSRFTLRRVLIGAGALSVAGAAATLVATGVVSPTEAGVFTAVGVESIGIPVPGETALIAASAIAGQAHGSLPAIIGFASAGAIIGDNIGYAIGRVGGDKVMQRFFRSPERQATLKVGRYLFRKYGVHVVFFGRFMTGIREIAAFMAGAMKMEWRKFFVANALGAVTWASAYGTAAYYAGKSIEHGTARNVIFVTGGTLILGGAGVMKWQWRKLKVKAEAMFPGPIQFGKDVAATPASTPKTPQGPAQDLAA